MIYVTHDQVEAMTMGDRIVVMKDGVIQQIDAPLKLYHEPGEPFRGRVPRQPADEFHHTEIEGGRDGAVIFKEGRAG